MTGLLGRGGYGSVYSAEHTGTGQAMALKMMGVDASTTEDDVVARFYREARITAGLTDVHTVRVFDVGQVENGPLYMAMEMLRGPNLFVVLRRLEKAGRRLTQQESIALALPILQSLAEAHAAGLVHRDLKPANIIIATMGDNHSVVKVLDFGIAHTQDSELTSEGQALGTPAYMSPEQVRGREVDGRADLYSLGVILYRCLAGKPPFDADDSFALAFMHVNEDVPPLRPACEPGVTDGMVAVVERSLAKSADDRFQTANEMYAALQEVAAATPAPMVLLDRDSGETTPTAPKSTAPASVLGALVSEVTDLRRVSPPVVEEAFRKSEDESTRAQQGGDDATAAANVAGGDADDGARDATDDHATAALDVEARRASAERAVGPHVTAEEQPTTALDVGAARVAAGGARGDAVGADGGRSGPANRGAQPLDASSEENAGRRSRVVLGVVLAVLVAAGGAVGLLGLDKDVTKATPTKPQIGARAPQAAPTAAMPANRTDADRAAQLVARATAEASLVKRQEILGAAVLLAPDNPAYKALLDATKALRLANAAAVPDKAAAVPDKAAAVPARAAAAPETTPAPAKGPTSAAAARPAVKTARSGGARPTPRAARPKPAAKPQGTKRPAAADDPKPAKKPEAAPFMDF